MKVDIIMPTYNPKSYIVEAIDSCLNQSYKDYKLTVVDDCSTSDISGLKKRYPQVNFIKTPENVGPGGARNYGISMTTAPLISFLDDDDIMNQEKLFSSVHAMINNPELGMVCGNYKILVNGRVRPQFYPQKIIINHAKLMSQNFVASGSTTIRRDVFNKIGPFNEKYWIAEDYDYWLRISELYPIEYIHKVMYYYRIIPNGGSLTQRSDIQLKHAENIKEIRKASIDRMDLAKSTKKTSD